MPVCAGALVSLRDRGKGVSVARSIPAQGRRAAAVVLASLSANRYSAMTRVIKPTG